jgi:hypothetical protein
MRVFWHAALLLLAMLPQAGCAAPAGSEPAGDKPARSEERLEFRAEVVYNAFERGFWGLVSEDGRRYDPGGLPREFQKPGLKVKVTARPVRDRVSFRMWGSPIAIEHIEPVESR